MMKKLSIIVAVLAVMLKFSSCNFLETESQSAQDESFIFSNPTLADGALLGAYHVLGIHGSYRNRLIHAFSNADTEMHNSSLNGIDEMGRRALAIYNITPAQAEMGGTGGQTMYCFSYMGIERLNIVIHGIRNFGNMSDPAMAHIYGEALALRAFFYFDLIKRFGDVPARFEPVSNETLFLGRTERDSIYKQILEDLAIAADLLPWPNEAPTHRQRVDRMNQAFARAFRARVALFAGGYSLRADDGTGQPGMRRSNILDRREMYEIARLETSILMQNEGRGFRLEDDFEQIFRDNMGEIVSVGREVIFELPFNPNNRGEWASFFGTQHTAPGDMFSLRGRAEVGPTPFMWYFFNDRDIRRDVSIIHHVYAAATPTTAVALIQRGTNTPSIRNAYFGKLRHEWGAAGRRIAPNDDGIKPIVMRYADVLLMYAEATNFLNGGPTQEGIAALTRVRARAFPNGDPIIIPTNQEGFLQTIMDERAFEFLGEQRRKYDLIRWNRLRANLDWARRQTERLRDGIPMGGTVVNATAAVTNRDIDFSGFPRHIFWRNFQCPDVTGVTRVEIFGLRRGEFPTRPDGSVIEIYVADNGQPTFDETALNVWAETFERNGRVGGWNRYLGTNTGENPPNPLEWVDRRNTSDGHPLSDHFINNAFYMSGVNPDLRSLFPIWTTPLVASQGHLNNRPFYE